MRRPRLILHPKNPQAALIEQSTLQHALQQAGLINQKLDAEEAHGFEGGVELMRLICFLGCSPKVILDQAEAGKEEAEIGCGSHLTYVRLPPAEDTLQFLSTRQNLVEAPKCSRCKSTDADWHRQIQPGPQADDPQWQCPNCGHQLSATRLPWRKTAGFARQWLEIIGIYPSEAVPDQSLLDTLGRLNGERWVYFYDRGDA